MKNTCDENGYKCNQRNKPPKYDASFKIITIGDSMSGKKKMINSYIFGHDTPD